MQQQPATLGCELLALAAATERLAREVENAKMRARLSEIANEVRALAEASTHLA